MANKGYSSWRYEGNLRPRTWTAGFVKHACCDCGKLTERTYNNGHIFQCETCAAEIQAAGGRAVWRRRSLPVIKPAEVIPASEPPFETVLAEGAALETIKAIGNQDAMEEALIAYTEKKRELTEDLERAA